jgi:PAS domain S-box-containing protein
VLAQEAVEGIVLSENGKVIDANRSVTEMFGYGLEELIGKNAIELTPPEYREMVMRRISDEDTRPYESMGLKRDGTIFPIEIRPRHLPYSGHRIRVTSLIDLTERKHQEEALRQSEALYRTMVEQAEENIFLVDAKSRRVLDANDALLRSLGFTDDELKEMTLYDIVAHDQESVDLNIERIMEEGHRSLGERQYRRKDGSLADVEVNASAVPYNGEKVMCVVAHDVTGRKRAECMLEEIREAERNRLARELHDSTLQDIVYALQEVQVMQVVSGDDLNPALEATTEALKRPVEGLCGAIFELRLKETLDRSVASSLENLVDLNRRMARGRYEVELVVEDDFPARLPDKAGQEVTRLVQETLTNVRRHAEAGHVRVELGLDGQLAYVEVSDDGCGFDPERATTGIGRQSMRHRALELGGELGVERAGRGDAGALLDTRHSPGQRVAAPSRVERHLSPFVLR